jgi:hypothetical protein
LPIAPVDLIASPDRAPGVFGDELLERSGELRGVGHGAVDVGVAQDLAPHPHPLLVTVLAHNCTSRCSAISSLTVSGCWMVGMWAASSISCSREPATALTIAS